MGQLYQCCCRICGGINVFPSFKYHMFTFRSMCVLFTDYPLYTVSNEKIIDEQLIKQDLTGFVVFVVSVVFVVIVVGHITSGP